ncbi:MAG: selenide, water dikinase SelD [Chloroflexi bacterium]|nr:selenide, water dikinase SelD [Chloroflexota bacterium]
MLRPIADTFQPQDYPDLLVGLSSPDDAAIWRLDEDRAIILTTDFFTPVVDDAYDYGAIAAANSLSDVYAMGGKPFLALNIAALPPDLPAEISAEILRGGAEKAHEAGVVIAGGHTVQDKEPKYGLVVVGFVDPRAVLTKGGARPGDRLVLTKPLGFGVTTTALKREQAAAEDVQEVVAWMKRLNRTAGQLAVEFHLRGGTDVTGYSLLGHAWEMASASGVGLRLHFDSIPLTRGARKYAEAYTFPGGASDNREFFSGNVDFTARLSENEQMLLFDPQTSGGLLLAVPPAQLEAIMRRAAELDQPAWEIGEVIPGSRIEVI